MWQPLQEGKTTALLVDFSCKKIWGPTILQVVALETAGTGVTCNTVCPGWVLTPCELLCTVWLYAYTLCTEICPGAYCPDTHMHMTKGWSSIITVQHIPMLSSAADRIYLWLTHRNRLVLWLSQLCCMFPSYCCAVKVHVQAIDSMQWPFPKWRGYHGREESVKRRLRLSWLLWMHYSLPMWTELIQSTIFIGDTRWWKATI